MDQLQDPSLISCLAVDLVDIGLTGDILLKDDVVFGAPAQQLDNTRRLGLAWAIPTLSR